MAEDGWVRLSQCWSTNGALVLCKNRGTDCWFGTNINLTVCTYVKVGMCQSMVCIKARHTGRESSCFRYTGRSALQGKAKAEDLDSETDG